jgi:hypothetical protein
MWLGLTSALNGTNPAWLDGSAFSFNVSVRALSSRGMLIMQHALTEQRLAAGMRGVATVTTHNVVNS